MADLTTVRERTFEVMRHHGMTRIFGNPGSTEIRIYPCFRGVGVLESGGDGWCLVVVLVFGWGEHIQGAVAPCRVVEQLDVVVDGGSELDPCLPSLAVEELDLHASPERLDHRVVGGSTDSAH